MRTKQILSMILAFVMVLGLLPATAFATDTEYVYVSVSFDGKYINDKDGGYIAYVAVPMETVAAVNLDDYNLSDYWYDVDGDGTYETTALQLIIYAHENIYGGSWDDVTFTGDPGSTYFQGGIFGFDENLQYYLNGQYPLASAGWGATSDQIVLETGDFIDMASFSSWDFYQDSGYGFHYFADENGDVTHDYTAEAGTACDVKLIKGSKDADYNSVFTDVPDYTVSYGTSLYSATGTVTTDSNAQASITFPSAGTWYLWVDGGYGTEYPDVIVSAPGYATITVTGESTGDGSGSGAGSGDSGADSEGSDETETSDGKTALKVTVDEGITLTGNATYYCNMDCEGAVAWEATSNVDSIDTSVSWVCGEHSIDTEYDFYMLSVNAFYAENYIITGITVNGTKYVVDMSDDNYDTTYLDDYSYIAENTNCVSIAIAAEAELVDQEIYIHAEKVVSEEEPRQPQDVSSVLNATMAQLAATVTEPVFGTTAGEWTVFSLARGNYYAKDNAYFTDYYERIVETVNETAASVNMSGALHASKSTENSRLIVALSAIGKNATSVGDWDLVEAYSANGFDWIKKQGLNGTIWALLALDSNNYETSDSTIRQQCIDSILSLQHDDGGWALSANLTYASNPDVTGMALTALYPYRDQEAVATACAEAFACLSELQHDNGVFASDGSECSESCAWVIVAATTWGINPDTDSRFIKNDISVVDALLSFYLEDEAMFEHMTGAGSNAMATDQSCYALVAYDRFVNGKTALLDYSDVTFDAIPESDEMTATLGLPAEINGGDTFNGIVSISKWDNEAGYKLIDFIVTVPEGVSVTGVTAGSRLAGGELSWNLEAETGKLRVVYFDANENTTLTVSGEEFPAELFTISFKAENVTSGSELDIAISGMSVKLTSDSSDEDAMIVVNTDSAKGTVDVVVGISFSAVCLYTGDDVDLIPSTKKAVAVAVTGITGGTKLTYNDGTNEVEFKYSAEITAKTGVATYVALVDATIAMENFINESYFTVPGGNADALTFGDSNGDGVINAQDALAAVNAWLRVGEELTDDDILTLNVNGDSRINTFDALGIVEKFVNGGEYGVITKAATITTNQ